MPLYEYQCEQCAGRFERIQKFSDPPVAECPNCGGPVRKLISSPAIQFKGSGWYITDYARSGSGDKAEGAKPATSDASSSKEKSADTKTDAAASSSSTPSAKADSAAPAKPAAASETK